MAPPPAFKPQEIPKINDALHEALANLEDFSWPPWDFRCVEFHLGQGHYKVGDHFGWHMHKELQLEVILTGEFEFGARGRKPVYVRRGDVFSVPPEIVHRWKCTQEALMIGIGLALIPRPNSLATPLQSSINPAVVRPVEISPLTDSLLADFRRPQPSPVFAAKRLTCWMYLIITQTLNKTLPLPKPDDHRDTPEVTSRSQRVVGKIIRFIDANIDGDLSMERFEKAVGLSARQIHRLFIEVTGRSCHRYVMERRLDVARAMIQANPAISIKEVSYATGFISPAHFSSTFKKVFGISPSQYQQ